MGLIELALVIAAGLVTTIMALVLRRGSRRDPKPPERGPLSPVALLLSALAIPLGATLGASSGGSFFESVLSRSIGALPVILSGPGDALLGRWYGAALGAAWMALPGAAALGWLLLSRSRSQVVAAVFAGTSWLGFALGMALGAMLLEVWVGHPGGDHPNDLDRLIVIGGALRGMAGLGVAGACFLGLWVLTAASDDGPKRMTRVTLFLPLGALFIGALTTPPDLLSQLLLAAAISVAWLGGLGAGSATALIRGARR